MLNGDIALGRTNYSGYAAVYQHTEESTSQPRASCLHNMASVRCIKNVARTVCPLVLMGTGGALVYLIPKVDSSSTGGLILVGGVSAAFIVGGLYVGYQILQTFFGSCCSQAHPRASGDVNDIGAAI